MYGPQNGGGGGIKFKKKLISPFIDELVHHIL